MLIPVILFIIGLLCKKKHTATDQKNTESGRKTLDNDRLVSYDKYNGNTKHQKERR